VDPASHLLFGQTAALAIRRRTSIPGLTIALIVGSILPDADAILAPMRFDWYLRAHAAGTHSLTGSAPEALVLALVVRALVNGQSLPRLFLASWLGVIGHIFWDVVDGSDIRLLAPFADVTTGWHLVSMGEPVVLLILVAVVVVAWRRPAFAQGAAVVALLLLAGFLGVKRLSQIRALSTYSATVGPEPPRAMAVAPQLGRLRAWTVYDRRGDTVRGWRVDGARGLVEEIFSFRDASDSQPGTISRRLPVVQTFLMLATKIPFARIEHRQSEQRVLWSDVTSCSSSGCDVSFGGAFDDLTLAPLYQVIHIGTFSQTRSVAALDLAHWPR
jgi:membrane-bound metal-dependent hydrolase YbcI (DUF457 family)